MGSPEGTLRVRFGGLGGCLNKLSGLGGLGGCLFLVIACKTGYSIYLVHWARTRLFYHLFRSSEYSIIPGFASIGWQFFRLEKLVLDTSYRTPT